MEAPLSNPAACEVRSVIRFLNQEGVRPVEIHRRLTSVYGNVMNQRNVRKWCVKFLSGRTSVHDEEGRGRRSAINDALLTKIENKVREDRRLTVRELAILIPEVSKSTIQTILTANLGYAKVCARWVPKMLTEDHKKSRVESSREFLDRFANEGDAFLDSIVTGDETWVYHLTPESKRQSMTWRHSSSPRVRKFRQTISNRKIMATVFWDRKGIIHIEFLPQGTTINADRYCQTLKNLRRAIQNKRRGMLTKGVCLLHDNARPHTANVITALLNSFKWNVLRHPAHSPDLAPSDYHLFLHLKQHLAGKRFETDENVEKEVRTWLRTQAPEFYDKGIKDLVLRLTKCIDRNGDYVEK